MREPTHRRLRTFIRDYRTMGKVLSIRGGPYLDCRDETLKALQVELDRGIASRLVLHTPRMWIHNLETWGLAKHLGGTPLVQLIRMGTPSRYRGVHAGLHRWATAAATAALAPSAKVAGKPMRVVGTS
jgi:hypothetical protein